MIVTDRVARARGYPMRLSLLCLLLALVACEQRDLAKDRAPHASIPTGNSSECGRVEPELLRFLIGSDGHNTECSKPEARRFWLEVRAPVNERTWPSVVHILPHYEPQEPATADLPEAGLAQIDPGSRVGQWLACEARAGRRPVIQVEMCLSTARPAGFQVVLVLQPGEHQVSFPGHFPKEDEGMFQLRGAAGMSIFPLQVIPWGRRTMVGEGRIIQVFHLPGSPFPSFRSLSDSEGVLERPSQI